jgi:hypothetical protein
MCYIAGQTFHSDLFIKLLQFISIAKSITIVLAEVFVRSTLSARCVGCFFAYLPNKLMNNLKEIGQEGAHWFQLAQDRYRLGFV